MASNAAVFDSGPIIHLSETDSLFIALQLFDKTIIPEEVKYEINQRRIDNTKLILTELSAKHKDLSKILADKYNLHIGEAQAISLALQENIKLFLTDDLDARTVAKSLNLDVHGTLGLILRAFRKKVITRDKAIEKINLLHSKSSLFLTRDLVNWTISKINEHKD